MSGMKLRSITEVDISTKQEKLFKVSNLQICLDHICNAGRDSHKINMQQAVLNTS